MSIFSASSAASASQRVQAAANAAREAERKRRAADPATADREANQFEAAVQNAQTNAAVRALRGNGDEETHDDREQHDGYAPDPGAKSAGKPRPPQIDIQG